MYVFFISYAEVTDIKHLSTWCKGVVNLDADISFLFVLLKDEYISCIFIVWFYSVLMRSNVYAFNFILIKSITTKLNIKQIKFIKNQWIKFIKKQISYD